MGIGYRRFIPTGLSEKDLKSALAFNRDYFGQLQNQGIIKDIVFGFNIEDDPKRTGRSSSFSVGGFDESIVKDKNLITYHPVSTREQWTVFVEKIEVNDLSVAIGVDSKPPSPSGSGQRNYFSCAQAGSTSSFH